MSAPHISLARRAVEKAKGIRPMVVRRLLRGGRVFITLDDGRQGAFEEVLGVLVADDSPSRSSGINSNLLPGS